MKEKDSRTTNIEPLKALKQLKPLKGLRELAPLRPLFTTSWGDAPCRFFLAHGRLNGALADERDRHRVGAHAVARDAAGGGRRY